MKTETKSGRKTMAVSTITNANHQQIDKITRWDRITKKHLHSVNVQTSQVRRIFDMQFVSGDQMQQMSGRGEGGASKGCQSGRRGFLDPALVMDMRHEIIRRKKSHSSTSDTKSIDHLKTVQLERIRSHHNRLEQIYVDQEIDKFRKSLRSPKRTEFVVRLDNYQSDPKMDSYQLLKNYNLNSSPEPDNCNPNEIEPYSHEAQSERDNNEEELTSKPLQEYQFDVSPALESVEEDLPQCVYRKRTATLEAKGFQGIATEVIHPFDDIVDPKKIVRFEYCVKDMNADQEETNSEDSFVDSLQCIDSFSNQICCENYEPNNDQLLQLIGKHIDVPVEVSHQNPKNKTVQTTVSSPETVENLPVLSVTKINTNDLCKSVGAMSVILLPKRNEVAMTKNEIIADLFYPNQINPSSLNTIGLLRKYFQRWFEHSTAMKIARDCENRDEFRQRKINAFMQTVRQQKQRQCTKVACFDATKNDKETVALNGALKNKLNSKLKMQREIIDLQNIKLERQERLIAELKLNRLTEETRKSQAAAKDELRNVIRHGNAKLRSTARCVQLVGNLREDADETAADEFAKLQARGIPKFLIDMQARAMERNARHQEARDRRERLEREKEEQRLAAEEAKLKQNEEAKRQRIEELREKRKLERLQRQQREEDRIRYLENMHKAVAFNKKRILKRYGMDKFHALIKLKRRNQRKVQMFRVFIVLRSTFGAWRKYVELVWAERKRQAIECRRLQLLRLGMDRWKRYQALQTSKLLVAIDWYDMRLTERVFRRWDNYARHEHCIYEVKMRQAEAHYNWHLKWRVIEHWQRLHAILQLERETDERRQKWRLKIWELLPDYQPAAMNDSAVQHSRKVKQILMEKHQTTNGI